jgi:hypothetical protein
VISVIVILRYEPLSDGEFFLDAMFQVVRFVDGHTEEVLAGHTTFVPSSQSAAQQAPFTWRTAFKDPDCKRDDTPASKKHAEDLERCLPESQRSAFMVEIHLEEGNIVQQGKYIYTVHFLLN